ncbi:FG-GAP repeat protein [Streptomyces sp. NPDC050560]|uniref:FG-GAP repeat protein n=1 Tax=Streptomyces sp. NPDC050560 TaxID=3365630 RepID=UPI0037A4E2B7
MKIRTVRPVLALCALCAVLAPLAGCGDGAADDHARADKAHSPQATKPPAAHPPAPGKGSEDPDDINGDGHRDLLLPVYGTDAPAAQRTAGRYMVVYGSPEGPDAATRTVYRPEDLGLPEPGASDTTVPEPFGPDGPLTADLDGDGFPDVVATVLGDRKLDRNVSAPRGTLYVSWGGPKGPAGGADATQVRLPADAATLGVGSVVRGDFDGDGHHDLAALAVNQSSVVVLYGPFTRAGAPARTDTHLPWADGTLYADAIDPSGKRRATSLVLRDMGDGEQATGTLYRAAPGTGPAAPGVPLRAGNALAFGDFDGDGRRDVAVGDDGSRNDEPGYETEAPDVTGSYAVYPGTGAAPVAHRLPKTAVPPPGTPPGHGYGGFVAADPDGDGRDALLTATRDGATLLDGDLTTPVTREGPAAYGGRATPAKWRHARPVGAADFDGDGRDELLLDWGPGVRFGLYGEGATRRWVTDGATSRDMAALDITALASDTS